MENENIGQAPISTLVADQNLPPAQPPQNNSKRLTILVILFVVIAIVGIGAYALGAKTQPTSTPQPSSLVVVQPTPTPDLYTESSRSATANWKTYTNNYFSFQYPSSAKLSVGGIESQTVETLVRSCQGGCPDVGSGALNGYNFKVAYGVYANHGSAEETASYYHDRVKGNCPDAETSPVKTVTINNQPAWQYSVNNCYGDYLASYVSGRQYVLNILQLWSGDPSLISTYKNELNQILSTFKFLE